MAVHSPADGHLTLNSAMNIHIQVFVQTCIVVPLGKTIFVSFLRQGRARSCAINR